MAIFLRYGSLAGGSEAAGYEGWTEIATLAWGFSRGLAAGTGTAGQREAAAPSLDTVALTARQTVFSPLLLQEGLRGGLQAAEIHFTRTGPGGTHMAYQIYKLGNAMIASYGFQADGDEAMESFSLHFQKLDSEYVAIDDAFQARSQGHVTYDAGTPATR